MKWSYIGAKLLYFTGIKIELDCDKVKRYILIPRAIINEIHFKNSLKISNKDVTLKIFV